VTGVVASRNGTLFGLCDSTIHGAVTVSRASGFVVVGDPADDGCPGNHITGPVTLLSNHGGAEISSNVIFGAVTVTGTTGTGPFPEDTAAEIERNTINGALLCLLNTPPPTNDGQPNTVVGARAGQCSSL
jgi:hypothetical protein